MTFFQKLCLFRDNVEKYCRVAQAIDDNKSPSHFMHDI